MARKSLNFCLAWAFVLGCWGGVIAAAACPHVGCETDAAASRRGDRDGSVAGGHEHGARAAEGCAGLADAHGEHAAESPARAQDVAGNYAVQELRPERRGLACTHCVGRPEAPPSTNFEFQTRSSGKGSESAAPAAGARFESPASVFTRKITPAQHAPPGLHGRRLLLNVFRI